MKPGLMKAMWHVMSKINSSEKGNHEINKCESKKKNPRINRMRTFYFPNINVLMYKNIDTYTNLQKGISITTALPISFLKGISRKINKKKL